MRMLMVFARMFVLPFAIRSALVMSSTRWTEGRMRDGDRVNGSGRTHTSRMRNGGRQAQSQQNIGKLHFARTDYGISGQMKFNQSQLLKYRSSRKDERKIG